jgi:hypothetical protein
MYYRANFLLPERLCFLRQVFQPQKGTAVHPNITKNLSYHDVKISSASNHLVALPHNILWGDSRRDSGYELVRRRPLVVWSLESLSAPGDLADSWDFADLFLAQICQAVGFPACPLLTLGCWANNGILLAPALASRHVWLCAHTGNDV